MNPFDHFVKRELRCPAYLRYVDDFLLFSDEKPELWAWKTAIEKRLASLRLTIHPGAHPRPVTEGFGFLGFVIYLHRRRLKRRKGIHYRRGLKRLIGVYHEGNAGYEDVRASVWASNMMPMA